jgi:hypothetical protein
MRSWIDLLSSRLTGSFLRVRRSPVAPNDPGAPGLHDHTDSPARAFDPFLEGWRPVTIAGPEEGDPRSPITPVRFSDGRVEFRDPFELLLDRPNWTDALVLDQ